MSFVSLATVMNVTLLNSFTFSRQITSAVLIKHSRINSPSVKGLELIPIKLRNEKRALTAEQFGLLLSYSNSCFCLTVLIGTISRL